MGDIRFREECFYCRMNGCSGGCTAKTDYMLENNQKYKFYKEFHDKWVELTKAIAVRFADPYAKIIEDDPVTVEFRKIQKKERDIVLAQLTEEQRRILNL